MITDFEESNPSTSAEERANKPLWTCSDNSFRFNFFTDSGPPPQQRGSAAACLPDPPASLSFTGQSSAFAFHFQIPPAEIMETTETGSLSCPGMQHRVQEEAPSQLPTGGAPACATSDQCKTKKKKKKKKSERKKASDTEAQEKPTGRDQKEEELSAEEQLNRQLDWCIEKLELGIRSQKGTPKQREEASQALRTLRSSKAPLVKKRQVMRGMDGDYRKKMEEERNKQFRLIQSETASAQVKVASGSPKKSVFHRRAEGRTRSDDQANRSEPGEAEPRDGGAALSFVPSKEEFHFNFF